jgi:transglutaminase-like putative cysteine protease
VLTDFDFGRASAVPPRSARIAPADRKAALAAERFLEVDDPAIRKVAQQLAGKTDRERARAAFERVVDHLSPRGFRGEDFGARAALDDGRGDCTEYADLLIALLRARRIPARYAEGYLTRWSDTAKHDWVEAWLDGLGWVPLDPLHADFKNATFDDLEPKYLRLSVRRNDDVLDRHHFYSYRYEGDAVQVEDAFEVLKDEPVEPAARR